MRSRFSWNRGTGYAVDGLMRSPPSPPRTSALALVLLVAVCIAVAAALFGLLWLIDAWDVVGWVLSIGCVIEGVAILWAKVANDRRPDEAEVAAQRAEDEAKAVAARWMREAQSNAPLPAVGRAGRTSDARGLFVEGFAADDPS